MPWSKWCNALWWEEINVIGFKSHTTALPLLLNWIYFVPKCLSTKTIQRKTCSSKTVIFPKKLKISKISKISEISENFCLKHIKIDQNYLKSNIVCFSNIKTQSFLNNSCITENECVIAFLKSLCITFMFHLSVIFSDFVILVFHFFCLLFNLNLSLWPLHTSSLSDWASPFSVFLSRYK